MTIYAVYKGYDKEKNEKVFKKTFKTWSDTQKVVIGVSLKDFGVAPVYKKCENDEAVISFFNEQDEKASLRNKSHLDFPENTYHIFVDGSFSKELEKYSSGLVILKGDNQLYEYKSVAKDTSQKEYYQVPGELRACMIGLKIILEHIDNNPTQIVIFHDYEGVHKHATGEWERDTNLSKEYYKWFQAFKNKHNQVNIDFIKVDAHKGNFYNERADKLAEEALIEEYNKTKK